MKKSAATVGESPSRLIDARIQGLDDWRGKTLARVRTLIKQADHEVAEEWKWSVPVWSHDGLICTGETYKSAVKLTFARGASLAPKRSAGRRVRRVAPIGRRRSMRGNEGRSGLT